MDRLVKTQGIIISRQDYRESSLIIKILTRELGVRNYIQNGVRTYRKSGSSIALFQPMTVLDLVVYDKYIDKLNRISSYSLSFSIESASFSQNFLLTFMADLLNKVTQHYDADIGLYDFVKEFLNEIKRTEQVNGLTPVEFTFGLLEHLGISFESAEELKSEVKYRLTPETLLGLNSMIAKESLEPYSISRAQKNEMLDVLINHIQYQTDGFSPPKSIEILRELN
jgi:DNA repair protein RecO (recombination protein O)